MIIETERLILREYTLSDVDDLVEGLNNFDIAKNLVVPFPYNKSHAESFINKNCKHTDKNYSFAIQLKNNNKVIGGTSLEFNEQLQKFKGGIWFNQKYIGKGYGTEVWKARAKFAFETLKLTELENGFFDYNQASWHMQEKVGYKIVGKKTNFCPALNKEVVEIVTLLKKEDFKY